MAHAGSILQEVLSQIRSTSIISTSNILWFIGLLWASFEIYKFTLHPLRRFPGPAWWIITRLPYMRALRHGQLVHQLGALHARYGPIVRVAWNELSFNDARAWSDIHGNAAFKKNLTWYSSAGGAKGTSVADANDEDYARIRKALLSGLSDKALKEQEPLLQHYVGMLIGKLRQDIAAGNEKIDISQRIDYALFDLFGDLSLGESFHCLEGDNYHPFVEGLVHMGEGLAWMISSRFVPGLESLMWFLTPKSIKEARTKHMAYSRDKIRARLAEGEKEGKPDFVTFMCRDNPKGVPKEDIEGTFTLLVIAGSETTSTALTAIMRELAKAPEAQGILAKEVRGAFATEVDISLTAIRKLPYLNACVDEGLRLCPPAPLGPSRVVPRGGAYVCGEFIPGGTIVSVRQFDVAHSEANFSDPEAFRPSRWTNPETMKNHNVKAFNPFVMNGYRGCLGRSLAYAELRLILARLVWNFDWEDRSGDWKWKDQAAFLMWRKFPVHVKLSSVRG